MRRVRPHHGPGTRRVSPHRGRGIGRVPPHRGTHVRRTVREGDGMRLTIKRLEEREACEGMLAKFIALCDGADGADGIDVTAELCVAHATEFNWDWAAENLLS